MVYGENVLQKRFKSWKNELKELLQANPTLVMVMMTVPILQIQVRKEKSKLKELNARRRNELNKSMKEPNRWNVRRELNK